MANYKEASYRVIETIKKMEHASDDYKFQTIMEMNDLDFRITVFNSLAVISKQYDKMLEFKSIVTERLNRLIRITDRLIATVKEGQENA